jgi:hypothetical protein
MFYAKNIPRRERTLRVIAGLAMIAFGLLGLQGQMLGYAVAAGGVVAALTGFVGFCPMCALVGRKLDAERRRA